MIKYIILLQGVLCSLVWSLPIRFSQDNIFVEDSTLTESLIQFAGGESVWGDIDDDGDIDLVLSGYSPTIGSNFISIYDNDGEGKLHQVQILDGGFLYGPYGAYGGIALGDYDNDGDLDIFVTGGGISVIFKYSDSEFEMDTENTFPALLYSKAAWGDLDNDGDLDLFLMGLQVPEFRLITRIYINDPLGTLTFDETQILANIANGDAAWGDYDNDGDLDLVVSGQSAETESHVTKVYKNEPTGRLIEDTNQQLEGLKAASVAWKDYDNDGDLDLITTGWNGDTTGISLTIIYKNEPVGTLSDTTHISFGVSYGSIDFGDFDNDGDLDMVIAGAEFVSADAEILLESNAKIFSNNGSGVFHLIQTIPGGISASFSDYDGDGDLDLFLNGYSNSNPQDLGSVYTKVFKNTGTVSNNPPLASNSLSSFAVGNQVILTWSEGSDIETSNPALIYNLQMGTEGNKNQILSGVVPLGVGNNGQSLIKVFQDISPGTYVWRVQTIDQGLIASEWSKEDTLIIPRLVESIQSLSGVRFNTAVWNDYNNDGTLDLALTGISFALGDTVTRIFKNKPLGLLTQDLEQNIESVVGGSMIWGDYNNDGYLDFILSGVKSVDPLTYVTYLYRWNVTTEKFELDDDQALVQVWGGSQAADWGDYDNDGDLDLVIGGINVLGERELKIYKNNGQNIFIEDTLQFITPMWPCIIIWVDFNQDGYIDLFTSGVDSLGEFHLKIYLNNNSGLLIDSLSLSGEGVAAGSAEWGDYNSDGYPDLAITGFYENIGLKLKIFKNSSGMTLNFIEEFPGIYYGNLNWGDYDNDGDLDLVMSGNSTISGDVGTDPITRVYRNTGSGSFMKDDSLFILGAGTSTVLWGDYNSDGDLDLLVAGTSVSEDDFSLVYDNLESINNENLPPYTPSGIMEIVDTSKVILNWVESEDRINPNGGSTPSSAITYNLQLGYNDGSHEIVSGNVSYGFGALGSLEKAILKNLKDGIYYWRVQAVDNGFARSEWSITKSFYFDIAPPEIDTVEANYGSGNQINLVITFREANGMNNSVSPEVIIFYPDGIVADTAMQQSYSGNVWTGVITLPEDFPGQVIKISIQGAKDLGGYEMAPFTVFRTPSKVISSQGGTVISEDGRVTLQLSPNAVTEDVVIRIHPVESFVLASVDTTASLIESVYEITPESLVLEKPTILSILYDTSSAPTALLGFNPNSLFIGRINTDSSLTWIGGTIDTTRGSRRISTSIDTLGHYAVFENIGFPVGGFRRLGNLTCQPRIFSPRGSTFATKTSIIFDLQESEKVTVRIFNPAGRLKRTLVEGQIMNPGKNTVSWDGRDDRNNIVVSGLYIVTVEAAKTSKATTVGVLNK